MVKDTAESGATVSAVSEVVSGAHQPSPAKQVPPNQSQQHSQESDATAMASPVLTDWKIEMNPRQEYTDPITCHYVYAGGTEGNTVIEWFRQVCVCVCACVCVVSEWRALLSPCACVHACIYQTNMAIEWFRCVCLCGSCYMYEEDSVVARTFVDT